MAMANIDFSPRVCNSRMVHYKQAAAPLDAAVGHLDTIDLDWRKIDKLWIHIRGSGSPATGGLFKVSGLPHDDTNEEVLFGSAASVLATTAVTAVTAGELTNSWSPTIFNSNGLVIDFKWSNLSFGAFATKPDLRFNRLLVEWDPSGLAGGPFTFDSIMVMAHFGEA